MKLIITEEQLRLIIESEGRLFNVPVELLEREGGFEKVYNLYISNKESKGYNGIKMLGDFVLNQKNDKGFYKLSNEIVEVYGSFSATDNWGFYLPKLKRVTGDLILWKTNCKLPELEIVGGTLNLNGARIVTLPMLSYVGESLKLNNSQIKSFTKLEYVGGDLDLKYTPIWWKTTEEDLRKQINVQGEIKL